MMKVLKWCALCVLTLMLALGCALAEEAEPITGEIVDLPEQIDAGAELAMQIAFTGSPSHIGYNIYRISEEASVHEAPEGC